jgi:hypothetical protein
VCLKDLQAYWKRDICASMFIVTLSTKPRGGSNLIVHIEEWIKKMWYTREYYPA